MSLVSENITFYDCVIVLLYGYTIFIFQNVFQKVNIENDATDYRWALLFTNTCQLLWFPPPQPPPQGSFLELK